MKKRLLILISSALMIASVIFTGCFEKTESENSSNGSSVVDQVVDPVVGDKNVVLSGTLGTGFVSTKNVSKASGAATQLVALTLINKGIMTSSFENMLKADINSDGTFSMPLNKDVNPNCVFLLVNPTLPKAERVLGYLSISDVISQSKIGLGGLNSINTMINIPITAATGNIALGPVNQSMDEAVGVNPIDFSLPVNTLMTMAKTDDTFKIIKSTYINYDGTSNSLYDIMIRFCWMGKDQYSINTVKNQFSPISDYFYQGYTFDFWIPSINPFFAYNEVANKEVELALYPPSSVSTISSTYDTTRPFSNFDNFPITWHPDGTPGGWTDNDFKIAGDSEKIVIGLNASTIVGAMPSGYWSLKRNGVEVSLFDLSVADPFYSGEISKPRIFIPSVKVTVDPTTNEVITVEIEWYLFDKSTASFEKTSDLSSIDYQITLSGVGFSDGYNEEISKTRITQFKRKMYFVGGIGSPLLDGISIFYSLMKGVVYQFTWNEYH